MYIHNEFTVRIRISPSQLTLSEHSILFSAWQNIEVAWLLF